MNVNEIWEAVSSAARILFCKMDYHTRSSSSEMKRTLRIDFLF
jgi:hypothetical protein